MFQLKYFKPLIHLLFIISALLLSASIFADETKETDIKAGTYSGAKTATHPHWFKESFLDLEEDINDASKQNKRLVVYFWQPGCPYCSQLWEDNFSKKEIEDSFRKHFQIIAINLWGDRDVVSIKGNDYTEKSFAEALNIQYTPTLLFFNEQHKVELKLNGYIPPEDFKLALEYAANKSPDKESYANWLASRNNAKTKDDKNQDTALRPLHKEDFFSKPSYHLDRSKQAADKMLAVFFEKEDCKNCDLLHQKTLQIPETRQLAKQFEAIQLNRYATTTVITPSGTNTTAKEWANTLGISYLPAIIFFDKDGEEVMRIDAQMRSFHVQSIFDYVLSGDYKTHKNFQRYISARADKLREQGINVDIWAY